MYFNIYMLLLCYNTNACPVEAVDTCKAALHFPWRDRSP